MARKSTGKEWAGGFSSKKVMDSLLDEVDEERARKHRQDLGAQGWLLSWMKSDCGNWMARLSAPGHQETLERVGRTRVDAIERAEASMRQVLEVTK